MKADLRLGMIGLDTSHVTAFAQLLHDTNHPYHVPGGKIVAAFPGGSDDFELSSSRVDGFSRELVHQYGVHLVHSPRDVAEQSDAIFIESVDGRVHLQQFSEIVSLGKPVFIDKPFALRSEEAQEMVRLAEQYDTPLMSCSALRFSEALTNALAAKDQGAIIGCDTYGPMELQSTQPGLFWYGIHSVEMLFAVLGKGCVNVTAVSNSDHDLITGEWSDGRVGTVRGNRKGNAQFGALIHRDNQVQYVDVASVDKPFYASLLERVMELFSSGTASIEVEETLGIIRFIEAANESLVSKRTVRL